MNNFLTGQFNQGQINQDQFSQSRSRRRFLQGLTLGAAFFTTPGLFAEQLSRTPSLTEGPFYPDKIPLDADNDLILINDSITPAVGEITHLTGRLLGVDGSPLKDVTMEIWQCDSKAVYLHSADSTSKKKQQDQNFQGFGRFTTGSTGEYRFRTIKPVAYPGRPAPHIHVKLKAGDRELLTTQIFVRGDEGNKRDGIYSQTRDLIDRELLQADFIPIKESKTGEYAAVFDIVVGRTPDENSFRNQ